MAVDSYIEIYGYVWNYMTRAQQGTGGRERSEGAQRVSAAMERRERSEGAEGRSGARERRERERSEGAERPSGATDRSDRAERPTGATERSDRAERPSGAIQEGRGGMEGWGGGEIPRTQSLFVSRFQKLNFQFKSWF